MAYDEYLEERISRYLNEKSIQFESKKMMGGLCYMVDNKMCVGIVKTDLMARLNPDNYENYLKIEGARPMDFTKRPMSGYVFVSADEVDLDSQLEFWIDEALQFNPLAKSSKKKKKTS